MAERPLLLFPQPEVASRSKQKSFGGKVNTPSHQRQIDRLTPVFSQLQSAFIEIQSTAAGADPEQVLVIEIIGDIKDFANAVKRIEGFEWMGEWEEDEIPPDADFFVEENPEKQLSGRLYLVMANQRALENMLSLWRRYQADPSVKFNSGLNKFKEVFKTLKSIRRWGVQDRLIETGVLDEWRELLQQSYGQVRFEVELWFRDVHEKDKSARRMLRD